MAEQYQNFGTSTTTATINNTSNPVTVPVASIASFPATFPFRITVSDQAGTNAEVMCVTGASTGTLTATRSSGIANVAAAEVPTPALSTHSSGSIVSHNLTAGAMNQIRADLVGTSGFFQTVTPPVAGNFSNINFNTGSGVVTTRVNNTSPNNSITLCQSDPSATLEIAAVAKSTINATFTITGAFTLYANTGNSLVGLWLSDGSANNLIFGINLSSPGAIIATVFSNFAGSFVTNAFGVANNQPVGPLMWLRIQETASNRLYFISPDGINFFQVFSESNTAHFTTSQYGVAVDCRAAGLTAATCYSFAETHP